MKTGVCNNGTFYQKASQHYDQQKYKKTLKQLYAIKIKEWAGKEYLLGIQAYRKSGNINEALHLIKLWRLSTPAPEKGKTLALSVKEEHIEQQICEKLCHLDRSLVLFHKKHRAVSKVAEELQLAYNGIEKLASSIEKHSTLFSTDLRIKTYFTIGEILYTYALLANHIGCEGVFDINPVINKAINYYDKGFFLVKEWSKNKVLHYLPTVTKYWDACFYLSYFMRGTIDYRDGNFLENHYLWQTISGLITEDSVDKDIKDPKLKQQISAYLQSKARLIAYRAIKNQWQSDRKAQVESLYNLAASYSGGKKSAVKAKALQQKVIMGTIGFEDVITILISQYYPEQKFKVRGGS